MIIYNNKAQEGGIICVLHRYKERGNLNNLVNPSPILSQKERYYFITIRQCSKNQAIKHIMMLKIITRRR